MADALGWKWRLAGSHCAARCGSLCARASGRRQLAVAAGTEPRDAGRHHRDGQDRGADRAVDEIRERGERAVIFDLTGAFIETFYEPERDVILNPLDARCPAWSVFNDCTTSAEFHAAAKSLVPHDGGGAEQFWVLAARTLFVETCLKLVEEGRGTNAALASDLMNANLSDLHQLLEDTMAGPISTPSAAAWRNRCARCSTSTPRRCRLLPTEGKPFSIRDWVKGDGKEGSILFLSARYVDLTVLSQMLTLWLDTAINTLMTGRTVA